MLAHRKSGPQNGASTPAITFPNDFNARDRKFVATLAEDLNLALAWDGFDDEDRNIVTLSFPDLRPGQASQIDEDTFAAAEGAEDDWVDTSEDDMEESNVAVDRVLTKYSKAKVLAADDDEDDGFEASEARRLKEKIDEWKRGYYKVLFRVQANSFPSCLLTRCDAGYRRSSRFLTMTLRHSVLLCFDG